MAERRNWGKIRKLPSGRWQASYVGPDMERHTAAATFDTKDAAVAWMQREKRLVDDDLWTPPGVRKAERVVAGQTFGEYAARWLATRRTRHGPIKDRTREHYQELLDRRILPTFGSVPLKHITAQSVAAWHAGLELDQTPTATAHAYSLMHAIMASAAIRDGNGKSLIPFNPCVLEGAQKARTVHEAVPATPAELQVIIDAMAPPYRLAIALMSWCALRFGETVALERRDITTTGDGLLRVRVNKGVVRVGGQRKIDTPKAYEARTVAIPPHLEDLVRDHLDNHAEPGRTGKLFPNQTGGYLAQSTLNGKPGRLRKIKGRMVNESATGFRKACEAAGRPDVRLHDLRHTGLTFASRLAAPADVQARGGHSTMTAALRYQHTAEDRDAEIARRLSAMIPTGTENST